MDIKDIQGDIVPTRPIGVGMRGIIGEHLQKPSLIGMQLEFPRIVTFDSMRMKGAFGESNRHVPTASTTPPIKKLGTIATALATGLMGGAVWVNSQCQTGGGEAFRDSCTVDPMRIGRESIASTSLGYGTPPTLAFNESIVGPVSAISAELRVGRLAQIQGSFAFTSALFSSILGITRQGLYNWLDTTKKIRMHEANRERLAAIEGFAKTWRGCTNAPLSSIADIPLRSGRSIVELLSEEHLDAGAINSGFQELIAQLQHLPKTMSQRMADAGYKRRLSARSLPSDE